LRADIGRPAHRGKAQLAHACVVVANKKAATNAMGSSSNAPAFPINGASAIAVAIACNGVLVKSGFFMPIARPWFDRKSSRPMTPSLRRCFELYSKCPGGLSGRSKHL
jgi:hypothetical protein